MKRRSLKLFVFLLVGAIINVAVAWGCAAFLNIADATVIHLEERDSTQGERYQRVTVVTSRSGATQFTSLKVFANRPISADGDDWEVWTMMAYVAEEMRARQTSPANISESLTSQLEALHTQEPSSGSGFSFALVDTRGWPLKCLYSNLQRGSPPVIWRLRRDTSGFEIGQWPGRQRGYLASQKVLPIRPIFPGFAINTIFYAAIVWFVFVAPGAVRRRVRRKRGQCAACGYSRRGIVGGKCPECGATTIKQKAETQKAEIE